MKQYFYKLPFALLPLTFIISACPKPCINPNYEFAVSTQIEPDADSIKVGDTIFVSSSFPKKLEDIQTGQLINYNHATGIGSNLSIIKLVSTPPSLLMATNSFSAFSKYGRIYKDEKVFPESTFQLLYDEHSDSYSLEVGLIAKDTGIFYLGIGNGLSRGIQKSKGCAKASFDITLENTNQHLFYFSQWDPNGNLSPYEKERVYFIKVHL